MTAQEPAGAMAQSLLSSVVMKKTKKLKTSRERLPDRASELLINHRILWAVRDELKSDMRSMDAKLGSLDAKIDSVDAKFESLDAKIDSVDAKFESLDAKIDSKIGSVEAKLHTLDGKIERVIALVEEQNNRNRAVLDGYQSLYDRQSRVEERVDRLETTVLEFKKFSR